MPDAAEVVETTAFVALEAAGTELPAQLSDAACRNGS